MTRTPRDFEVAKHEAGHVASARLLSWDVLDTERFPDGTGLTHVEPPEPFGDAWARGIEAGVVLLSAISLAAEGSGEDHEKLGALAASGVPIGAVYDRTEALLRSPAFRALHARVTDALFRTPRLDRAALERIWAGG